MKIRKAQVSDLDAIHRLSWQLGYSPNRELVRENIARMLAHQDYELVVATNDRDQVLGWMSVAIRYKIEDVSFLQVAALVTDVKARGQGVGRFLMDYAAERAKKLGLAFVGLHSSKPRTEAHAFYEHIGYRKAKESFFFRKDLE